MTHPLIPLIATRPQLLVDHVQAYADLVSDEIVDVTSAWKRRALLNAVALCCLGIAAVLAGVALMLWTFLPVPVGHTPWGLVVAPLVPVVIAALCWRAARAGVMPVAFDNVRRQIRADVAMLRDLNA